MSLPRFFILTVDRQIRRFDETAEHLNSLGITWERLNGFDNTLTKLLPVETFDMDRVGEKIGPKHIAATLTHYLCWFLMSYQPDDHFIVGEYDIRLQPNFVEQYAEVMRDLPDDWQICFLGSCCTEGREKRHVAGNIWEVKYPLSGHGLMYRKSALPILLKEHQRISMPLDIALYYTSLPKLRTYCVLPRIIEQHGTPLPI